MKQYAYFPGCSLESMARPYHLSALEAARALDVELQELEDWNCCGATAYFPVDELLAYTLTARNLAQAEQAGLDLVAPCAACYKNAYSTNKYLQEDKDLAEHINFALEADNLHVNGTSRVLHLIEVFTQDVGLETIKAKVAKPLKGLRVAPYYGCQLLRPRKGREDVENPQYFESLLSALGAEPVDYPSKTHCCGGSLIITARKAALDMLFKCLKDAVDSQADMIATTCPMCHVNLEAYQSRANLEFDANYRVPIIYFTQLVGLAMGVPAKRLGIGGDLLASKPLQAYLQS